MSRDPRHLCVDMIDTLEGKHAGEYMVFLVGGACPPPIEHQTDLEKVVLGGSWGTRAEANAAMRLLKAAWKGAK